MRVVQEVAGLSLSQADILRRAIGKKKHDLLKQQQEIFAEGARDNGVEEGVIDRIWSDILKFADYGFNKSHSIAYAVLTARTAYLKTHFPSEFLAAVMRSGKDMADIRPVLNECKRMGIEVLPPCINKSNVHFYSDGKRIHYGLSAIKGLGVSATAPFVAEREANGEFKDFFDFWVRCRPNKKQIEALARAGALDLLCGRSRILAGIEGIMKQVRQFNKVEARVEKHKANVFNAEDDKKRARSQRYLDVAIDDFNNLEFDIPYVDPLTKEEILKLEFESIGCYISGHPLDGWRGVYDTDIIYDTVDGDHICVLANFTGVDIRSSKSGNRYAVVTFCTLEEGHVEGMMFKKGLARYEDILVAGDNVIIEGAVRRDSVGEYGKVFINKIGVVK